MTNSTISSANKAAGMFEKLRLIGEEMSSGEWEGGSFTHSITLNNGVWSVKTFLRINKEFPEPTFVFSGMGKGLEPLLEKHDFELGAWYDINKLKEGK